jgi:hypothetical protein
LVPSLAATQVFGRFHDVVEAEILATNLVVEAYVVETVFGDVPIVVLTR